MAWNIICGFVTGTFSYISSMVRFKAPLAISSDKYPMEPVTSSPKMIAVDAGLSMESQDSRYFTPLGSRFGLICLER